MLVSGAVQFTIIERDLCSIMTGKTTTGIVAARWWIDARDVAQAGRLTGLTPRQRSQRRCTGLRAR
jgi:hypothetical protein